MIPPPVQVRRGDDTVGRTLDGETVVYVGAGASLVLLDRVATVVWDLLEEPTTVTGLVTGLADRFGVAEATVAHDLQAPLETLIRSGVVRADVLPVR